MQVKQKVLVVDDDSAIRELMQVYLEDDFQVITASNGLEAIEKAVKESPNLILLDIMLPQKNGWDVCKEIRQFSKVPIIMVSAKVEEIDKILGLELGADDYITKPFSPRELLARVKAQIRRNLYKLEELDGIVKPKPNDENEILKLEELIIDIKRYKAFMKDKDIDLTAKEFELLLFLAQNHGQVFSREVLLEKVWGFDYVGDSRAVDSTIKRLRRKLNINLIEQPYIHTIWGAGYKFEVPNNEKNNLS